MSREANKLLLAFYGDDFTGSTDALESLSLAGAKTVLFIEPPTPEQIKKYHELDAIGVAGMTRAMVPADMEKELKPAFSALRSLGASHVHYKVCSTFDSSPSIGSIGKALDVGSEIFRNEFVPLLVAAPTLGRYCVFGNLFARMGIGSSGTIYRLDRHPSMSHHPVTPADESDLRVHLSRQTSKTVGLMDILQVVQEKNTAKEMLQNIIQNGSEVVLFDALYDDQMAGIGQLMDAYASYEKPLFSVGSSGIETALTAHWLRRGSLKQPGSWKEPGSAGPLLVVSGSCSPVTSKQITQALSAGFEEVPLDTEAIATGHHCSSIVETYVAKVISLINQGHSVIVHTSRGGDDERVKNTARAFLEKGLSQAKTQSHTAKLFGKALGRIARDVAEQSALKRIVIAGGDTSSFAAREMGIEAVEMIAPLSPGAPLCKAYAPASPADGLEIIFKGGQVGREDYFEMALAGGVVSRES